LRTDVTIKRAARTPAILAASFAVIIGGVGLWAVSPSTARGVGLIREEALTGTGGVDPGYLAHSGITTMLVYAGWIGLAAAVLALLSLLRASFRAPRPVPWLHPLFVGALLMLVVYSFAASGLVGQEWVIGMAAMIAALRFNAAGVSE
jgi:hypothetical protein